MLQKLGSCAHLGEPAGASCCRLHHGPAFAVAAVRGVSQYMENLSISPSLCPLTLPYNKYISKHKPALTAAALCDVSQETQQDSFHQEPCHTAFRSGFRGAKAGEEWLGPVPTTLPPPHPGLGSTHASHSWFTLGFVRGERVCPGTRPGPDQPEGTQAACSRQHGMVCLHSRSSVSEPLRKLPTWPELSIAGGRGGPALYHWHECPGAVPSTEDPPWSLLPAPVAPWLGPCCVYPGLSSTK